MKQFKAPSEALLSFRMTHARTLKEQMGSRLLALALTSGYEEQAEKVRACTPQRPCGSEHCYRCGVPSNSKPSVTEISLEFSEPPTPDDVKPLTRSRNYRLRGGQHLEAVFKHFDVNEVFAVSIHLALVHIDGDVAAELKRAKCLFKKRLERKLGDECVFRGFVEDKVYRVSDAKDRGMLREQVWADGLSDDDFVVCLHAHGSIHIPKLDAEGIKQLLSKLGYNGPRQVHVQAHYAKTMSNGHSGGGIAGWGQYASKRFIELEFGTQNLEVFRKIVRYRQHLKGKGRHLGHNVNRYIRGGPTYLCEAPMTFMEFEQEMIEDQMRWANSEHVSNTTSNSRKLSIWLKDRFESMCRVSGP